MPPAAGLRITGRAEAPTAVQDRRWRLRSLRSAQGGPRQRRQQAATRASLQHCAAAAAAELGAAAPVKKHRDVLVAEAKRSKRAPSFKAHGAPPLARPSCCSAPPSRSRRRAPPHRCREGGPLPWAPPGVSTPLPPLSSQIYNLEPQILLKKAFPCVNAAGKDDKCLR